MKLRVKLEYTIVVPKGGAFSPPLDRLVFEGLRGVRQAGAMVLDGELTVTPLKGEAET